MHRLSKEKVNELLRKKPDSPILLNALYVRLTLKPLLAYLI